MKHPPIETILTRLTAAVDKLASGVNWIALWTFCIALGTCSGAGT